MNRDTCHLGRNDAVGSVVLARSASANPSSFARYGPGTGPRLAHSSACASICFAITSLPTESSRPRAVAAAFTLIEVLLAVGVATALLLAALFFYRQATQLRADILASSTQLAALRLTLDQLAADLRTAVPVPGRSFIGGPASIEFARFAPPPDAPAAALTNLVPNPPRAPLESVVLSTLIQQDGTNLVVQGISRRTQPVGGAAPAPAATPFTSAPIDPEPNLASSPTDALAQGLDPVANRPGPTNAPVASAPSAQGSPLLPVRFLLLRYWNGADWQDSWLAPVPPQGVEVTLGLEPLPQDMPPEYYPHERFTRVVFIPAGQRPESTNNLPQNPPAAAEASP